MAVGVGAPDAGHLLSLVAARKEARCHASDVLDAEAAEFLRIAGIVFRGEAPEVIPEDALEGGGPSLGIRCSR